MKLFLTPHSIYYFDLFLSSFFRMALAFRVLCWTVNFSLDIALTCDLTRAISDSIAGSIACEGDNTSDLKSFLKKVVERAIEEYDRKCDGTVKKKIIGNWEEDNDRKWVVGCDSAVKEVLESTYSNWFTFARGKGKNICGVSLRVKGVWRWHCKIQTKRITCVDRTSSLLHMTCIRVARVILDNNKRNGARQWDAVDWKLSGYQTYINTYINLSMELPEVSLKRLMVTLEWLQWAAVTAPMRFYSFDSFGQTVLWDDLSLSYFE